MIKKTEIHIMTLLMAALVGSVGLGYLLLHKYTLPSPSYFTTAVNVCSQVALTFSYTSFNTIGRTIGTIAVLGTTLFVSKTLASLLKTQQRRQDLLSKKCEVNHVQLKNLAQQHHLPLSQVVTIHHDQPLAFTIGWWSPTIVLSTGLLNVLSPAQLEAVFLHELHHVHAHHPALFLMSDIMTTALQGVPLFGDVMSYLQQQIEHEADDWASEIQGTPQFVSSALVVVQHWYAQSNQPHFTQSNQTQLLQPWPAFAAISVSSRLVQLQGQTVPFHWSLKHSVISMITVCGVVALLLTPISVTAQINQDLTSFSSCGQTAQTQCTAYCQPGLFSSLASIRSESN